MNRLFALCILFGSPFALAQDLTVLAASSLTEAFEEIAEVFEGHHEGVDVRLSFDGSSTLATQITQGVPADVFASADEVQMQGVVDEGLAASEPKIFTGNRLVLITPTDSGVTRLEHLAEPGIAVVLADPEVPVGNYAREALAKMDDTYGAGFSERVLANVVSEETNVRQVSLKVELGEADAAIVYATDAAVAENIDTIDIPDDLNALGTYPIATLEGAPQPDLAQAFVELVLSNEGQTILSKRGFQAPE